MLVLIRRVGEVLYIGDEITIKVLGVRSGRVRLGIMAPREIPVHRQEVYQRILEERKARG